MSDDPQVVFQQIRQLKLRQDDLKREIVEVEDGGMKAVLNGEQQFLELDVPGISKEKTQILKKLLNEGLSKVQVKIMSPIKKMVS